MKRRNASSNGLPKCAKPSFLPFLPICGKPKSQEEAKTKLSGSKRITSGRTMSGEREGTGQEASNRQVTEKSISLQFSSWPKPSCKGILLNPLYNLCIFFGSHHRDTKRRVQHGSFFSPSHKLLFSEISINRKTKEKRNFVSEREDMVLRLGNHLRSYLSQLKRDWERIRKKAKWGKVKSVIIHIIMLISAKCSIFITLQSW